MSDASIDGWVLSIDFGTTATAGAMSVGGDVDVVEIDGERRMPSMVFWKEASNGSPGRLLLGEAAEHEAVLAPQCLERCPKRKLGQPFMLLGSERIRVTEAIGAIFQHVLDQASPVQGGQGPRELRLTHPARWGEPRLAKLREAAAVAGFDQPLLVPEPVGAAVFFAREQLSPGEHVAVYDLGGGTFDTAVLRRTEIGFEVVGKPGGRDNLGGEDFDYRLYQFLGEQLDREQWETLTWADADEDWQRRHHDFKKDVRRVKERLSREPEATVRTPIPGQPDMPVSRSEFESLIRHDIETTVDELEKTIRDAGQAVAGLSAIYLAGGSSRIPLVARRIEERLGMQPSVLGDPKSVIALGATRANLESPVKPTLGTPTQVVEPPVTPSADAPAAATVQAAAPAAEPVQAAAPAARGPVEAPPTPPTPPAPAPPIERRAPEPPVEPPRAPEPPGSAPGGRTAERIGRAGLLGGGLVILGALLVIVSRFLHWGGGLTAWHAFPKRYSVILIVLALVAVAFVITALVRERRPMLRAASYVGAYVTGSAFPLILPSYKYLQVGFWLGAIGAVLAVAGALIATERGVRGADADAGPTAAVSAVGGLGFVVLIGSLALHFDSTGSAWRAGDVSTHYPVLITLLSLAGIGLIAVDLRFKRLRALSFAALVSCFLFGEAFPVIASNYHGLKVGFWLGAVASLVAAAVLFGAVLARSVARGREPAG